jgi:hypothetical protein
MNRHWGVEVHLQEFLTSALPLSKMVSFTSRPSYDEGIGRSGHWIGGWVPPSPTAGLDAVGDKKIPCHSYETNPDSSVLPPFRILITVMTEL